MVFQYRPALIMLGAERTWGASAGGGETFLNRHAIICGPSQSTAHAGFWHADGCQPM